MNIVHKRYWILDAGYWMKGISIGMLVSVVLAPQAQAQGPAKKMAYSAFPMLQARNIFDPDRSRDLAVVSQTTPRKIRTESAPPVQARPSDYVVLTGIMMTEGQTLAFFAGSQPEYNKVIPLNGAIAGATITRITPSSVDVLRNGKQITVAVGQTVPFDDSAPGAPPPLSPQATPAVDPNTLSESVPVPSPAAATPNPPSTTSPAPAGDTSDVMRRMMERRQKQLQ